MLMQQLLFYRENHEINMSALSHLVGTVSKVKVLEVFHMAERHWEVEKIV